MRRDVFQAVADPVRREIIDMLAQKSHNLNAVAEQFDISRPAISKHMKILEECGVVSIRQQGRERHCSIVPDNLKTISTWADQYRQLWEQRIDSFEDYVNELQAKRKDTKS